jgi:hypothetical protein
MDTYREHEPISDFPLNFPLNHRLAEDVLKALERMHEQGVSHQ